MITIMDFESKDWNELRVAGYAVEGGLFCTGIVHFARHETVSCRRVESPAQHFIDSNNDSADHRSKPATPSSYRAIRNPQLATRS